MADEDNQLPKTEVAPAAGTAAARSLKALCAVLAVFAIVGIVLGLAGLKNSLRVLDEARQIELARKAIDEDVAAIQQLKQSITAANEKTLQEVRQAVPQGLDGVGDKLDAKVNGFERKIDTAIAGLDERFETALERVDEHVKQELADFDERYRQQHLESQEHDLRRTMAMYQDMSVVFSEVGTANAAGLTPRERLLLALLAAQLDPGSAELCLAAAQQAHAAGNLVRATALIGKLLGMKDLEPATRQEARALQAEIEKADSQPAMLEHQSPGRIRVGPYGIFDLHLNTLLALVRKGYLTAEEAQRILEDSKKQAEEEAASAGGVSIGPTRYVPVK